MKRVKIAKDLEFQVEGEEAVWKRLNELDPDEVCKRACVEFDKNTNSYKMNILNRDYNIFLDKKIEPEMPPHLKFLTIAYLTQAKGLCPTGKLKGLHDLKGGQFFFKGSHELPLTALAEKYGKDPEGFLKKGLMFGGKKASFGDVSFVINTFPKIPLTFILWKEDEEFPARVSLLVDETAEEQVALEELWGTTFVTSRLLLQEVSNGTD